jgi:hypothetical protein
MSKALAEWSNRLSIFWLKKNGYLNKDCSYQSGGITWSYNGNKGSSIGFSIIKDNWGDPGETAWMKLNYTHTNNSTQEKEAMDYRIELETTPCRFGGERYWFICPLNKNGVYCGRRVATLFSIGKWFGCRHCGNIAYDSQMRSGAYRWNGISVPDIERAEKEVKRYYYRGKPTRKYRRVIRLNEKFDNSFIAASSYFGGKLAKLKEK